MFDCCCSFFSSLGCDSQPLEQHTHDRQITGVLDTRDMFRLLCKSKDASTYLRYFFKVKDKPNEYLLLSQELASQLDLSNPSTEEKKDEPVEQTPDSYIIEFGKETITRYRLLGDDISTYITKETKQVRVKARTQDYTVFSYHSDVKPKNAKLTDQQIKQYFPKQRFEYEEEEPSLLLEERSGSEASLDESPLAPQQIYVADASLDESPLAPQQIYVADASLDEPPLAPDERSGTDILLEKQPLLSNSTAPSPTASSDSDSSDTRAIKASESKKESPPRELHAIDKAVRKLVFKPNPQPEPIWRSIPMFLRHECANMLTYQEEGGLTLFKEWLRTIEATLFINDGYQALIPSEQLSHSDTGYGTMGQTTRPRARSAP